MIKITGMVFSDIWDFHSLLLSWNKHCLKLGNARLPKIQMSYVNGSATDFILGIKMQRSPPFIHLKEIGGIFNTPSLGHFLWIKKREILQQLMQFVHGSSSPWSTLYFLNITCRENIQLIVRRKSAESVNSLDKGTDIAKMRFNLWLTSKGSETFWVSKAHNPGFDTPLSW